MTREEAIKTLRELWRETNDSWYEKTYDMAIEALSAEPPYQYSKAYVEQIRGERDILQDMVDNMAKPKTGWIPCSERLPYAEYGEGDSVLCCTESGLMYILYWNGGNWCVPTGEPHQWVNHKTGWHDKVTAWTPLPEPYKGGDSE